MPKGGAHFTSQELALVLSHYDIGIIQQIKPLIAGNCRAPKQIVISNAGRYFLKRRAKGKDDRIRIDFAHRVQNLLNEKKFPVSKLIATRDSKSTFLELDNHIYELFEYAIGTRFNDKNDSVSNAGSVLADFHTILKDFHNPQIPSKNSFHDSAAVRGHLKKISSSKNTHTQPGLHKTAISLMTIYNNSCVNVNQLGFDNWPVQIVHGDWHPGNMLFSGGKISAILDFDSLNTAPVITDIANGALQFSIVAGRPDPADWPDYLDQEKFAFFICGYCRVNMLDESQMKSLPDLMIETLIAEAVLPIAATGFFANFTGNDFLKMIQRKCLWIDKNRNVLAEDIERTLKDFEKCPPIK